jgi:acyl-CoA thioester hydrolase
VTPTWSAPVRFAEVDAQGIVFNSHYLLYCDEAVGAFFAERGLRGLAAGIRLVASTLTWTGSARWGDVVDVYASCVRVGRTSLVIEFDVRVGERPVCRVETTYVHTDDTGRPEPVPDSVRARLVPRP